MSEEQVKQLYAEAKQFSQQLTDGGWIDDERMAVSDTTSPADLFASGSGDRPLVVGLFGGTGVGKSSLLNYLAGSEVARTGVVRPTSMEITAYLHNDKQLAALPEGFPVDQFSEVHHGNDKFSEVMWVDMPDFDSEETQNRDQVLRWLPHIDLLIYVVTPERYKDEEGWRLLIENGYNHAWLFAMNQWDRGEDIQLDDFTRLLSTAGFDAPRIYRTVCAGKEMATAVNQLDQLAEFVALLAERNTIQQLEQRGWLQRLNRARSGLESHIKVLQPEDDFVSLEHSFEQRWAQFKVSVNTNLDLPFKEYSQQFADQKSAPLTSALKSITGRDDKTGLQSSAVKSIAAKNEVTALWDDWSETRLNDMFNQFELAESDHGVPQAVVSAVRKSAIEKTSSGVKEQLQLQLDRALRHPGSSWQRSAASVMGWLQWLLPLAAIGWIGYRVVNGFAAGAVDNSAYVGVDFLVNGLLLAGIAAVVPWVLVRLLKPSVPKSVYQALQTAVTDGLEAGVGGYRDRLRLINKDKTARYKSAQTLHQRISQVTARSAVLDNPDLKGLLVS